MMRSALPFALMFGLIAACGYGVADDGGSAVAQSSQKGAAPPTEPGSQGNSALTDGADDRPRRTMTESDRNWMLMAKGACGTGDFGTFLRAFGGSWAVREKYSAPTIQFGQQGTSRVMPRRQYLDQNNFPITPIDYEWGTADSYRNFEANDGDPKRLEYVELGVETASDNRRRVEWKPGKFEAQMVPRPEELEEGLGKLVEPSGPGGYLLFFPTADCWELAEDVSYPR